MKCICIIQARTGSKRFPNKVLTPLKGIPIVKRVYDTCNSIFEDRTVVAIPHTNRKLAKYLTDNDIPVFKGHPTDVLDRYYQCARKYEATHIVRITGDCPVISKAWLSYAEYMLCQNEDTGFISNCFPPRKIIDGNDVEIMSFKILSRLNDVADKEDREHVTSLIYKSNWELINHLDISPELDLSHIKTSIDTKEDFKRVEEML